MSFVQLNDITVSFGDRDVLKNLNLNLSSKSRVALSGGNGSGKTTFMKVIGGIVHADSGSISSGPDVRISYLPQSGLSYKRRTLEEEADEAFSFLHRESESLVIIEKDLSLLKEDSKDLPGLLEKHHFIHEKLLANSYYNRKELISHVLMGLGFKYSDLSRTCNEFSGGWQMRIALAKVLLENPDIMLLDEPTNYLDIEARNWLEEFLQKFRGGLLIVSHDRYFMDVTVNEVIELFNGDLKRYKGNYSSYEKTREAELIIVIEQYKRQQEEITKLEEFISRFRYNASKASMVQSRIKTLEKIKIIEIPENLKKMHLTFPEPPHSGKKVLSLKEISKAYGENKVLTDLDYEIEKGERIVIAGKNGAGKTTLLKIIAQIDNNFTGSINYGTGVKIAYFSQEQDSFTNNNNTIIEEMEESTPTELIPKLRALLGAFLFRNDDIFKPLSVLSGGEKSRLALLKLLLFPVNLLILDEPTNHLDIHSKDILLDALEGYSGTLLFVSHDRYFIENLANRVLELGENGPQDFKGDYKYYMWKTSNQEAEDSSEIITEKTDISRGKQDHQATKQIKSTINRLKKEEKSLLIRLEELESQQKDIEHKMADPENYSDGKKSKALKLELEKNEKLQMETSERWEEVEMELDKFT
ncbi:MAG: ABC-F family ATP-binding cassette domain-containing protein [Spirochaetales bacterium]|nr:ABC-F family ATP-binding cassette domain-containing protein [Spirochaetales bacterium]